MKANELLKQINPIDFYGGYGHDLTKKGNHLCNLPGHDDTNPSLSINSTNGLFNCFACGQKGNMINWYMLQHNVSFKEALKQIAGKYNIGPQERRSTQKKEEAHIDIAKLVQDCHKALPGEIREYLNARGIPDEIITRYKLGCGEFYGKYWIVIPVKNKEGKYGLLKLRRLPKEDKSDTPKMKVYPVGAKHELFDYETLGKSDRVVICEGEMDKLVLEAHGTPTVTSTGGVNTFKDKWLEYFNNKEVISVCFDKDEAGAEGAKQLVKQLLELKKPKIFKIDLPEMQEGHKDITDYLVYEKGNIKTFMENSVEITKLDENESRIKKVSKPDKEISFVEWKETIREHFPDCAFAAEVCLSIIVQILIKDITNPFALVLIDVPSAGKTITLNFFAGIEDLTYPTDKFTPASFVSNASNVKKEELSKIDLLPRIRYKTLIVRDFATIFGEREEDLLKTMGILTRILDGEGLQTDSGIHGQRQYVGEYLFMLLAASTPIMPRVWKLMGNLGSRLFFLCMNSRDKSENELAEQLASGSYKKKEQYCRKVTKDLLLTLWNKHPNGVNWNIETENKEYLKIIVRCAKLLARLRGTITVWKDRSYEKKEDYQHNNVLIEKPDRINQLFYNLCRGYALVNSRMQINKDDLRLIIELAIDSGPPIRARLLRKLLEKEGKMKTTEVEVALNCSKPTAHKEMETLKLLGLAYIPLEDSNKYSQEEKIINLNKDFDWFLSEECKEIRGLPLPDRQHTLSDLVNH